MLNSAESHLCFSHLVIVIDPSLSVTLPGVQSGTDFTTGVMSDSELLDKAIDFYRVVLALCPPDHSHRSLSLNNLAISLDARFKQRGVQSDLDEAIDLHRAALALCPPGHSHRSLSLNNLAISLRDRFDQRGVLSDLDEAIDLHQAALALRPPGHSHRSSSLDNLAISLRDRFKQRGVLSDLDEAIDLHQAALALLPPGHSHRSSSLGNLASSLKDRFHQQGVLSDLDEAFMLYAQLSQISHVVLYSDLHAIKSWTISAEQFTHSSALTAYQTALRSLDDWQHVAGLSSSSHYFDVVSKATSSLPMDAFSCGVRHNAFKIAVELAEQGRAVFWSQLARFHTPLDEISASGNKNFSSRVQGPQLSPSQHPRGLF